MPLDQSEVTPELVALWSNRKWRLNNLYYIEDKYGAVVKFKMNEAQEKLLDDLHYLNIVLKARQLGFSTLILLLALDCCLFNSNFAAGLIADSLDNSSNLLDRIKFAYKKLPEELKSVRPVEKKNASEIHFNNGSWVEVGVSLRSGTKNFLHISEYGRICAQRPDKAKEVKSGALNTLAQKQLGFIESTAEGRGGDFHDKVLGAQKVIDREPHDMEWKLHFYAWFDAPEYTTDSPVTLTAKDEEYFEKLATRGVKLTEGQKRWYALKKLEQGEDMLKEYPSDPEEAFQAVRDGAYFAKQIHGLRERGRIGEATIDPRTPVNTFWDLGMNDMTVIWLHQLIAGNHRFIGYYESSGEGIAHHIKWLNAWSVTHGAVFGRHFGPHDIEHRQMGVMADSIRQIALDLGFNFEVVPRTLDKVNTIEAARTILPQCEFDEAATAEGLAHLESYSKDWDEKLGVWRSHPRHDDHSHAADAFMTFVDSKIAPTNRPRTAWKPKKRV